MLSWEKVDAIPGWFQFQSYCIWRALLDQRLGSRASTEARIAPLLASPWLRQPSAS